MKTIFAKNISTNYETKIILGTSDAWSMSHLSQRPSKPAYYIEDCRIFKLPFNRTSETITISTIEV